jgi:hypothetical protein
MQSGNILLSYDILGARAIEIAHAFFKQQNAKSLMGQRA